jgi:SAM-dependent methyltransferase
MFNVKEFDSEVRYVVTAAAQFADENPQEAGEVLHLDNLPGARMYVRNANAIAKIVPHGTLLDWGCGFGHISWLLANRGYTVNACDWAERPRTTAFIDERVSFLELLDDVELPFADDSFDCVVSSGTLEHTRSLMASMTELRRIIKPGGWLVIYRFPNDHSISEFVARRTGRWAHPVRLDKRNLKFLMRVFGFRIEAIGYDSFLPIFLGRSLRALRPMRERLDGLIHLADNVLTRIPLVNRLSTSLFCLAQANAEYEG